MEGEHVGPFNLGNPSEFTMLELAEVSDLFCLCSVIIYNHTAAYQLLGNASKDSLKSLGKAKSLKTGDLEPFTHLMQHKVVICSLLWVKLYQTPLPAAQNGWTSIYVVIVPTSQCLCLCYRSEWTSLLCLRCFIHCIAWLCFTNLRVCWLLNTWLIGGS